MADSGQQDTKGSFLLSVVVPVYNEQEVLPEFLRRLAAVFDEYHLPGEFLFVNDGSTDGSLTWLIDAQQRDSRIALVDLSRNFGKEVAMSAGLDHASGDAVIIIDADLQDPPELIPQLIECWQQGYDVVYARRSSRAGETWLKKSTSHVFYRLMRLLSRVQIPEDTGDFRLLSRRAVEALKRFRESNRFMKGLFSWIGFQQKAVIYERDARFSGVTKWNYWRLWNFALEGITSFTTIPLKIATYFGILVSLGAFFYGLLIIFKTLFFGDPVPGYPSLMVVILFLGGVQLIAIGIIGEYLGRVFDETKARPLYLLNDYIPARDTRPGTGEVTQDHQSV